MQELPHALPVVHTLQHEPVELLLHAAVAGGPLAAKSVRATAPPRRTRVQKRDIGFTVNLLMCSAAFARLELVAALKAGEHDLPAADEACHRTPPSLLRVNLRRTAFRTLYGFVVGHGFSPYLGKSLSASA
jgi:hypothetical protein